MYVSKYFLIKHICVFYIVLAFTIRSKEIFNLVIRTHTHTKHAHTYVTDRHYFLKAIRKTEIYEAAVLSMYIIVSRLT